MKVKFMVVDVDVMELVSARTLNGPNTTPVRYFPEKLNRKPIKVFSEGSASIMERRKIVSFLSRFSVKNFNPSPPSSYRVEKNTNSTRAFGKLGK